MGLRLLRLWLELLHTFLRRMLTLRLGVLALRPVGLRNMQLRKLLARGAFDNDSGP